jgi:hypothetical protein
MFSIDIAATAHVAASAFTGMISTFRQQLQLTATAPG